MPQINQLPDSASGGTGDYIPVYEVATGTMRKIAKGTVGGGLPAASQAEAEAGAVNDKTMTPLRTKEHITANTASQAEAEAGASNTKGMTPLRTKQALDALRPLISTPNVAWIIAGAPSSPTPNGTIARPYQNPAQAVAAGFRNLRVGAGSFSAGSAWPAGTYHISGAGREATTIAGLSFSGNATIYGDKSFRVSGSTGPITGGLSITFRGIVSTAGINADGHTATITVDDCEFTGISANGNAGVSGNDVNGESETGESGTAGQAAGSVTVRRSRITGSITAVGGVGGTGGKGGPGTEMVSSGNGGAAGAGGAGGAVFIEDSTFATIDNRGGAGGSPGAPGDDMGGGEGSAGTTANGGAGGAVSIIYSRGTSVTNTGGAGNGGGSSGSNGSTTLRAALLGTTFTASAP